MLRLIGGVHPVGSGQVRFDGEIVDTRDRERLYRLRRRLGMLFQFGALFTDLSVFENVAFPLREHTDLDEAMIRDIVLMKLNAVGLRGAARPAHRARSRAAWRRRVALARAIALDPELMLYDEPFTGLDPISMGVAANLIRKLNDATGATSLVVSHDVQRVLRDLRLRRTSWPRRHRDRARPPGELQRQRRPAGAPVHPRRARRAGAVPLPRATAGAGPRTLRGA